MIFLKLRMQHTHYFCNYFVNSPAHVIKTSLLRLVLFHPLIHILAWYKISSNPLLLKNFPVTKKSMKSWKSLSYVMTSLNSSGLIQIALRPVSSMLTFPLWYNFPPISMRITSWIVKKVSLCWKSCPQKSWTPGDIFCPPRAFSYKSLIFDQLNWRH